ncbi:MAG TPA: gliding motility-associated C-terminal domain-containing protein [Mucilaginibacter sp.]|nr:gliding motility-associated C-terminal domain-containing protein [Mucilaginibacter sp.]
MDFHLNHTFLQGKNILKAKRDYRDNYLWVLTQNNGVYRINSLTNEIVDFSASFIAYGGNKFIDIAGFSKDTVFVAAKDELLSFISGTVKSVKTKYHINPSINSLGVDVAGGGNNYVQTDHALLIATGHGIYRYNVKKDIMLPIPNDSPSIIYASTYRTEMLSDGQYCRCYADTVNHLPAVELFNYTIYGAEIWTGGQSFGHTIKSAYYTSGDAYDQAYLFTDLTHLFWATEEGLFENNWNQSYSTSIPHRHFLKGADISKIASIYGLRSFGQGLAMENLLVGTSQGLYFSNSKYRQSDDGFTSDYSFFYCNELGNKAINDICVNADTYSSAQFNSSVCEDGVWVAAADGLYLLKPDYSRTGDAQKQIKAIKFDGQDDAVDNVGLCPNTSVTAAINIYAYSGTNVQWYKDGVALPNESNLTLKIEKAGDYYVKLYDACTNINFSSNHLKVTTIAAPIFTFNYPDKLNYCAGSTATLETENNTNYQYRWYKDGLLNGNTTSKLEITQPGKYKLEVSACAGNWVPTKEVQVDFIKVPPPIITSDKPAYCSGDHAVLTANVPLDATGIINWQPYQYRWYKDGVLLTASTLATLDATEAGNYKAEVTSCSDNSATSAEFHLGFITLATPVISADKPAYCIGDEALLSINIPLDNSYTIQWLKDGVVMNEDQGKTTIVTGSAGSYTVNIFSNQTTCSQGSSAYHLIFDDPPTINLERIVKTTLCDGQPVDIQATYSGGSIRWSTGETSDRITVNQSGTYTAMVTTAAGCVFNQNLTLQFFPNPVLNLPDATLCQFTNDHVTLTAPPGFIKYKWNGQLGSQTYNTSTLGTVSLTVTDQNGCEASQTIKVTSYCKEIHIPNTFTPNDDGINDTWVISGLENDPTVNVKVFDRWGAVVFQSQGYTTPWDGTYRNKKITAGVYYYVITAKGAQQVLSGYVTVIY